MKLGILCSRIYAYMFEKFKSVRFKSLYLFYKRNW